VLSVRQARAGDAAAIGRLLGELGYSLAPEAYATSLGTLLADPAHLVLVAADGDRPVGYVNANFRLQLHHAAEVATIDELVVAAGCRGEGVGARLVDQVLRVARSRGADVVEVSSAFAREGAHRFYERLGFERTSYKLVFRL
jgi:GNAT superfamily N-acetyltransferase